jgi:2-polyprenyl-6-methoxyphenol hydroxylase-like FAD-dependent oxidoreductase
MPPTYQWRREDYNRAAKLEEFLPWFKDWKFDWLDVPGLIENCPHAYEYPLVDRDPVAQWTFGRVTLMGDAAHPMYPVGSNGASQAILDARCLADRLQSAEHVLHGLWMYEQERLPMTAQIVRMNRKGGPEGVIDAVEERAPDGFSSIDDVLSFEQRKAIVRGYASTAGFAQEQVNKAA